MPDGPITAASLRQRAEWQATFPEATLGWEEEADEGVGIGFDGLDPSAMVRAFFRTGSLWTEVLAWYRSSLERLGWVGHKVEPHEWWSWQRHDRPGERFDVLDRGVYAELPGWPLPAEFVGLQAFEVSLKASSRPGVIPGESETFGA